MRYITRIIEPTIARYVQEFPVLALTGPRQSGKSTTLRHMFGQYRHVTFDDYKTVNFFAQDPDGFMDQYNNKVIFDEAQKVPELFSHVKIAVDNDRSNYGKFILTGSSQFTLIKKISESLAGRVGLLSMLPFQFVEVPDPLKEESVFKGGYPELVLRAYVNSAEWYSSYMHTYIDKDLKDLVNVGDLKDFNRLIAMLAANASRVLNMSQLSVDIGVTIQTIKRWIAALEASYIIFLLPAYYKNYGKRVIKAPKVYFYDTGLVSYLTGIESQYLLESGVMAGSIFENYIVSEIYKRELARNTHANLYYLRTSNQEEVDLIVDRKTHKDLFEIKFSKSFKMSMLATIAKFLDPGDKGYLLFRGKEFPYKDNIRVCNYADYLGGDL